MHPPDSSHYDVIILGGAFSGAAAALLLRRECPHLRVLVVEKLEKFDEKVGEATTEMSAMFLTRRLALWEHLEREHLPKEGLRYWFHNEKVTGHADATEAGGFLRSTVPAFQLRRDVLDEHILAQAVAAGAELWRPARVSNVTVGDFHHQVTVERPGGMGNGTPLPVERAEDPDNAQKPLAQPLTLTCRWLLDATGRVTFLGRKLGLIDWNDQHPTAAVWARWKNVRHIDDLAARAPGNLARGNVGSRRLATNHYPGRGYWVWVIPLGNGETSIGVVYDKRIHRLHEATDRQAEYTAFLRSNPVLKELLDGAELRPDDLRSLSRLAYATRQFMGNGWSLLGDAAAFLDPYYSPGLDHASFTVESTIETIKLDAMPPRRGRFSDPEPAGKIPSPLPQKIAHHNDLFLRSYHRFFKAAYKDKYYYMGEADLLTASFLLDTSQYYIFLVIPAYRITGQFRSEPVLAPKAAIFSYWLMRIYTKRFKAIAELRREMGEAGRRNDHRRIKAFFNLNFAPFHMEARGLKLWLYAELDAVRLRLKKLLGRPQPTPDPMPDPEPAGPVAP